MKLATLFAMYMVTGGSLMPGQLLAGTETGGEPEILYWVAPMDPTYIRNELWALWVKVAVGKV